MALKDIKIPKVDVAVSADSSFAVRGLSTSDIEHLVRQHGGELRQLFDEFVNGGGKATELTDLGPVLKQLITRVPSLVVSVIALAADADEEDSKVIPQLSISTQITALTAIVGMTLSVEGDLKKAMETAIKALGGVNGGLGEILKGIANQ